MKIHRISLSLALLALLNLIPQLSTVFAQGTGFVYEGQLQNSGSPANGTYNFQFRLYRVNSEGSPVAGPVEIDGVTVANGLFTVMMDFGSAVWDGHTNWLEIAVEASGAGSFTTLAPRQQITPAPYAIFATTASNLSGTLPIAQLASSSITVSTGTGLSPGGTVALGGSITLNNTGVTSLTGGDGVTVSAATGDLTLGLGSILKLTGASPVGINTPGGSLLYADNNGNYFAGIGAAIPALTGSLNTASGSGALESVTSGTANTAYGNGALQSNTGGSQNTAEGLDALEGNLSGIANTANGAGALEFNLSGSFNTATGGDALQENQSGSYNTVAGAQALELNQNGSFNTANGMGALSANLNGSYNVADGANALAANVSGFYNAALGYNALSQLGQQNPSASGGSNNIAIGYAAGSAFTGIESSNIDIGNIGVLGENNITRIGTPGIQTAAYIAGIINGDGSGLVNLNASQITSGTINSTLLASSPITVVTGPGSGLSGGQSVPLGGTITLNNTGVTSLNGGGGVTVSASSGAVTLGSTATSLDTASTIVSRDNNGNFLAGAITLYGNLDFVTNIAIGGALAGNTIGHYNIGIGGQTLLNSKTGSNNIAIGNGALLITMGNQNNIAIGNQALQDGMQDNIIAIGNQSLLNADFGLYDTALGQQALETTVMGSECTAVGYQVMQNLYNPTGDTAVGFQALQGGATENIAAYNSGNTAVGYAALQQTVNSANNTGVGNEALLANTNGNNNTAIGASALAAATNGNYNIAVGYSAGSSLTTGDYNIDIGNSGTSGDSGVIRIGTPGIHVTTSLAGICNSHVGYGCLQGTAGTVFGNTFNFWWTGSQVQSWVDNINVGTIMFTSDRRLKENIEPMTDDALTRVMALKPSTFKYKTIPGTIFQGDGTQEEGFIADELQQVIPSAVNGEKDALTSKGDIQPQTVNLMPVVAVLTKAVQDQQKEIDELKAMVKTLSARK